MGVTMARSHSGNVRRFGRGPHVSKAVDNKVQIEAWHLQAELLA